MIGQKLYTYVVPLRLEFLLVRLKHQIIREKFIILLLTYHNILLSLEFEYLQCHCIINK